MPTCIFQYKISPHEVFIWRIFQWNTRHTSSSVMEKYLFIILFLFFIYTCSLYSSRGITVQYTVISLVQFSDDMHVQCAYIHQVFQSVKWIQLLYITITSFLITYCVKNKKNLYTICSLTVCFLFYMYIDL